MEQIGAEIWRGRIEGMKINPMCDLLVGNRPENDSDTQYYECENCYRYEICKNYGCVEMCSLKEIKEATPNILEPSYDLLKQEGYFEMSMISERVKYLREFDCFGTVKQAMLEAADTIEALSAKLQAANMERSDRYYGGGWIACEDRLPEKEGFYLVTLTGRITDIADMRIKKAFFSENHKNFMDYGSAVIAWQPLPEPYRP